MQKFVATSAATLQALPESQQYGARIKRRRGEDRSPAARDANGDLQILIKGAREIWNQECSAADIVKLKRGDIQRLLSELKCTEADTTRILETYSGFHNSLIVKNSREKTRGAATAVCVALRPDTPAQKLEGLQRRVRELEVINGHLVNTNKGLDAENRTLREQVLRLSQQLEASSPEALQSMLSAQLAAAQIYPVSGGAQGAQFRARLGGVGSVSDPFPGHSPALQFHFPPALLHMPQGPPVLGRYPLFQWPPQ